MKPPARVTLATLPMVNRIVDARREQVRLLEALDVIDEPQSPLACRPLAIAVDGQQQDEAMKALVRPVIAGEIRARIASLDRDLEALGVSVGQDG